MSGQFSLARWSGLGLSLVAAACTPVWGSDSAAGKKVFRTQCALCHSAQPDDNGGAQGPDLYGVFGRKAASHPAFTYSEALRRSNLTWDAATLDRFLASPTTVVPGSLMVVAVTDKDDRENLITYFKAVKDGTFTEEKVADNDSSQSSTAPPKGEGDWMKDVPGRVHRIDVAALPAPFATPSARNSSRLIAGASS